MKTAALFENGIQITLKKDKFSNESIPNIIDIAAKHLLKFMLIIILNKGGKSMLKTAYLSLGSNMGDKLYNLIENIILI